MILAVISCVLADIAIMLPAALLYFIAAGLYGSYENPDGYSSGLILYTAAAAAILAIIALTAVIKHRALMKLSQVPQPDTDEKMLIGIQQSQALDSPDLRIRSDALLSIIRGNKLNKFNREQKNALIVSAFVSASLFAGSLFIFDVRIALAAFWPLPFALIFYLLHSKVQSHSPVYYADRYDLNAAMGEYLSMCAELKDNNAENWYLERVSKKISLAEFSSMSYNRSVTLLTAFARLIPEMALASVTLAGSVFFISGTLPLEIFILSLLVSARIYVPLTVTVDNIQ